MSALLIEYPDSLTAVSNQSREAFETDAKWAMSAKLYELGKLSSGQAAELLGISRVAFLLNVPKYGTPSVSWDRDEIDREFGKRE